MQAVTKLGVAYSQVGRYLPLPPSDPYSSWTCQHPQREVPGCRGPHGPRCLVQGVRGFSSLPSVPYIQSLEQDYFPSMTTVPLCHPNVYYSLLSKIRIYKTMYGSQDLSYALYHRRGNAAVMCLHIPHIYTQHINSHKQTFQGENSALESEEVSPAASPEWHGDSVFILIDSHLSFQLYRKTRWSFRKPAKRAIHNLFLMHLFTQCIFKRKGEADLGEQLTPTQYVVYSWTYCPTIKKKFIDKGHKPSQI